MKHRTGLLAALACAVAAATLLAVPALAATTFTVSPGGAWSGTRAADSTVGIRDAVSNQVTLCSGLAVAGSFKSGRGLSGTGIGALTSIAFTGCCLKFICTSLVFPTKPCEKIHVEIKSRGKVIRVFMVNLFCVNVILGNQKSINCYRTQSV